MNKTARIVGFNALAILYLPAFPPCTSGASSVVLRLGRGQQAVKMRPRTADAGDAPSVFYERICWWTCPSGISICQK